MGLYLRLWSSWRTLLALPSPLHPFNHFHLPWVPQFISSTPLSPMNGPSQPEVSHRGFSKPARKTPNPSELNETLKPAAEPQLWNRVSVQSRQPQRRNPNLRTALACTIVDTTARASTFDCYCVRSRQTSDGSLSSELLRHAERLRSERNCACKLFNSLVSTRQSPPLYSASHLAGPKEVMPGQILRNAKLMWPHSECRQLRRPLSPLFEQRVRLYLGINRT